MAMVTVNVPEGVYEGQEFLLTYEGQELMVCCPDGCGPGDEITLEVPAVEAPTGACSEAPALVDVCVPEGCFAGMVFTVTFDGTSFDITVPEGVQPGEMLTVEVPASSGSTATPSPTKLASIPEQKVSCAPIQEIPDFRHTSSNTSAGPQRVKPPAEKYLKGLDIPAFKGKKKGVTANSVNADAKWNTVAGDLFSALPSEGFGKEAGDFAIGQLVQVARSDGSWTYGKIMDYDPSGDVYSVMTKRGPKYFVEKSDITEDVCINPGNGGCAQQ